MRLAVPVLLLCLAAAAPLRAEPDAPLHVQVRDAWAQAADSERLVNLAGRLAGQIAPPEDPPEDPSVDPPRGTAAVEARPGEIQAAITQLAILSGSSGPLALQLAQASGTEVIDLVTGNATLADMQALAGMTRQRDGTWHLSRPLVVWPGAALVLAPGDRLELDTAAGAFILSFGTLSLTGATLRGDAGHNARVAEFRPFLLVTGQGAFSARQSTFADLGFRGPVAFRGVSVLTGGLMRPGAPTLIADSRFQGVFSLSFEGADGMRLTGNRISGAGAAAVSVKDGTGIRLESNRILATAAGAGVRLSGRLRQVAILGNLIERGGRNGVQIDGTTLGLVLRGNVVTGNVAAGVSIRSATCLAIQGNIIAGNGTSGLRLFRTGMARLADNAILSNGAAGISVERQAGPMLLSDNLIADNREGLRAAGLDEIRLAGNDLADQLPRQFAGDFAPWIGRYLSAEARLVIPAASSVARPLAPCLTE